MAKEIQVAVDCADPARLASFWADALGYEQEAGSGDWAAVVHPDGAGPRVLFNRVPEGKTVKNRVHLDVRMGAIHVSTIEDEADYFAVMLDPERNEFCVC